LGVRLIIPTLAVKHGMKNTEVQVVSIPPALPPPGTDLPTVKNPIQI
jgi:hypothetical protein